VDQGPRGRAAACRGPHEDAFLDVLAPTGYAWRMSEAWRLFRDTGREWYDDRAQRLDAALAFYTLFALAPGLVILIPLTGVFLGTQAPEGHIVEQIIGRDARMSDLLILLSSLGGIVLFGAVGFIVGPSVAALFVTVWHLCGEEFRAWLRPTGD
jgi:hypothetical protein